MSQSKAQSQLHTKLLQQAAEKALTPLGLFQKGRSRIWIDDRGWWIVVVEFQPSSWSQGSYLNVGAMFLWDEKDNLSFDVGGRCEELVAFENESQFAAEAQRLVRTAVKQVRDLRTAFRSIAGAARPLRRRAMTARNPWMAFHAAIALGYAGKRVSARLCFSKIKRRKPKHHWEQKLRETAQQFASLLDDPEAFKQRVQETIFATRRLLKLPDKDDLGIS